MAFAYRRTPGGALARWLAGLAAGEVWGSVDADGRVRVPPVDGAPASGAPPVGFRRLAPRGTVRAWTWAPPVDGGAGVVHALIELDGAATAMVHQVAVDDVAAMAIGMRVAAVFADERRGAVTDIRAFVPEPGAEPAGGAAVQAGSVADGPGGVPPAEEPAETLSAVDLAYRHQPGHLASVFLRALADRRILGGRCPRCRSVVVPIRPGCPACGGRGPVEPVEVAATGRVATWTVVHQVARAGVPPATPFVTAWIVLDGADVPVPHLLGEVAPEQVTAGMWVEAVWRADGERPVGWEAIRWFRPAGRSAASEPNR